MVATLVETKELWQTVVVSLVAGVGITAAYSILIFGVARSADLRRDDRTLLAAGAAGLSGLALLVVVGTVVLGIVVMVAK